MSNDDLPRSHAEETDSTKLGESVGQADRSGDIFPPEQPLAVGDPGIRSDGSIAPDDVDIRDRREQPERVDTETPQVADLGHDLLDPSADPDRLDDEAEMIADEGDDADAAAEVAAVHVVPENRR